jgi:soluble lytic murein transglycosylase-like protein
MDALTMRFASLAVLAGVVLLAQSASAQSADGLAHTRLGVTDFVSEASRRFAIPESWIYAVMRVESAGDPRAVSPKGATGLMQIMPATWITLRARYALGADIYDAHDNIVAGAGYLRELYDRYGSPGFLAAYNAGPARYEAYLARHVSLPGETIAYVQKLAPIANGEAVRMAPPATIDPTAWTRAALFVGASSNAEGAASDTTTAHEIAPDRTAPEQGAGTSPPRAPSLFIPLSGQARR